MGPPRMRSRWKSKNHAPAERWPIYALPELHRRPIGSRFLRAAAYTCSKRERAIIRPLEAHTGFEPARSAWKAETLPLHQCAILVRSGFPEGGHSRTNRLVKEREEV